MFDYFDFEYAWQILVNMLYWSFKYFFILWKT
jgi:hypothetical protein